MKQAVKVILAVVGVMASLAVLGGCIAHYSGPEAEARHIERVSERLTQELDLNELQRTHLDTLRKRLLTEMEKLHNSRDASRTTLLELLQQPTFDRIRALTLVEARTQEVAERSPAVIAAFADFYDALDAKQQTRLRELVEKRWQRRERCWR